MAGHTPGPWFVDIERGFPMPIEQKDGLEICRVGGNALCIDDPDEAEANARLLAAAPELLDALMVAKGTLEIACGTTAPYIRVALDIAAAAIAKAEGREPAAEGQASTDPRRV